MQERRIRFPSFAKYRPYNGEPTIEEYFDHEYPRQKDEPELEWLFRCFGPIKARETQLQWLDRLSLDPVFVQGLTHWPVYVNSEIYRIDLFPDGSFLIHYKRDNEVSHNFRVYGKVMDRKLSAQIRLQMLPPQKFARRGRYGAGFKAKSIVFDALSFMEVQTDFVMEMKGHSFFNTNQVEASPRARQYSSPFEIYRPDRKTWSIQVNSLTSKDDKAMVVLTHVLQKSPEFVGVPESSQMRWQFYNAQVGTQALGAGKLWVRGAMSPEVFILLGTSPMVSDAQLKELGFPNGYPSYFEGAKKEPLVQLAGQTTLREVHEEDIDRRAASSGPVTQFYAYWNQMQPPLSLLQKLKGFNRRTMTHAVPLKNVT